MRALVTLTSIKKASKSVGRSTTGDQVLDLARCRTFGDGSATPKLVVEDLTDGTQYVTDLDYSTALTTLQGALPTSGTFVLT